MSKKTTHNSVEDDSGGIKLTAISPIAYALAKEGDWAEIKPIKPRANEYRSSIGVAREAFLVFKGNTKIGMIPREAVLQLGPTSIGRRCRIVRMDKERNLIAIAILRKPSATVSPVQ